MLKQYKKEIQIQHLLKLNYYYKCKSYRNIGIQIQHLLKLNPLTPLGALIAELDSNTTLVKVK